MGESLARVFADADVSTFGFAFDEVPQCVGHADGVASHGWHVGFPRLAFDRFQGAVGKSVLGFGGELLDKFVGQDGAI